jgi:hypothetical protein
MLALAAESGAEAIDTAALSQRIANLHGPDEPTSTQEKAWLLLAAHALMEGAAQPRLALNGEAREGPLFRRLDARELAQRPFIVLNRGRYPVDATVSVSGVPATPPPAGGDGYSIERAYYGLAGRRVQPDRIAQGERLIAVLTITSDRKRAARLIVNDPLPAGFEIDNPHLIRAGDVEDVPWLGLVETAAHKEFRTDRFVAAVTRGARDRSDFQLAYRIRAVSPGRFVHPAATVEDMYRPARRGWTAEGMVEVVEKAER